MERDTRIASHQGIVTAVAKRRVSVQIESVSACGTCSAHAHCGFAESKNKTVEITTADWQQYHTGDNVTVHITEGRGMLAVWIAYVVPALLMIADIVVLSLLGLPELAVVGSALGILAVYVGVLFARRAHLSLQFVLSVEPC